MFPGGVVPERLFVSGMVRMGPVGQGAADKSLAAKGGMMKAGFGFGLAMGTLLVSGLAHGGDVKHRFLVSDFMNRSVHFVDEHDASRNWTLILPELAMDMQLLEGGRLLCNRSKGYDIYELSTRQKVESFQSEVLKDIRSVRRLEDGRTFFGSQGGTVYEFDAQRDLTVTYEMPRQITYVRMMRFTPRGTVLLAAEDGAYEVSLEKGAKPEGRVIRKFALPRPRNAYMALYAPDGNLLLSGGYSKGFYTFTPDGVLLKDTVVTQPDGLHNYFYAGFQVLKNGNIVMANWTGHNEKDFKPGWKLIELDRNHEVVWTWNEPYGGTVNQLIVLDE